MLLVNSYLRLSSRYRVRCLDRLGACSLARSLHHAGQHSSDQSQTQAPVHGEQRMESLNGVGRGKVALLGAAAIVAVGAGGYMLGRQRNHPQPDPSIPHVPTKRGFENALEELRKSLPDECISTDRDDLHHHAVSPWSWYVVQCLPGAVLYPRSTEDVVSIVKIASRFSIPLIPYSGGTALEGHYNAPFLPSGESKEEGGDLQPGLSFVVNFSENMDRIIEVHENDLDVVVQPGVKYQVLNQELEDRGTGLFFPVDPGPGAEIGGMISTGCSGTNAVRYGTMRENVLNLTVVLPNGEVVKTRQRARKSSAGPDLGRLFIGAEGTLGLITEATLKLQPVLPYSVATTSFQTVQNAVDAVVDIVRRGIAVQCVELVDEVMIRAINKKVRAEGGKLWEEIPMLFIKFAGTEGQVKSDIEQVGSILTRNGGRNMNFAKSKEESDEIWTTRKNVHWITMDYIPGARHMSTDVCVPISSLPKLVYETKDDLAKANLTAVIVGHVGDGNFHAGILIQTEEELKKAKEVVKRMVETAQRLDGTCTGEHGIGVGKREYLEAELGKPTVELLRRIKKMIDPQNIMNPGKLIPPVRGEGGDA